MRFPHTLTFTRDDGTTYTVRGFAEEIDGTTVNAVGVRELPRVEALCNPTGYGVTWEVLEGDRMAGPYGIGGLVTSVRPITSATNGRLHHVEVTSG